MKTRSRRQLILALAVLFMAGLGTLAHAFTFCDTYQNSRAARISGQAVCAYTGSTCTECTTVGGGNGQVCADDTAGRHYCSPLGPPNCL